MTDLNFYDSLVSNRFSSHNTYRYANITDTNLRFFKGSPNYPYIMYSGWHDDDTILSFSNFLPQLRNRLLNISKIKEIMNTAHMPLIISIRNKLYLIGKGFMAHAVNKDEIVDSLKLLFVATATSIRIRDIAEVKFFVSRDIYKEDYKSVAPAIKDLIASHPGDVILTNNIEQRIGDKIPFPTGGTLEKRQKYKRAVMVECIDDYFS